MMQPSQQSEPFTVLAFIAVRISTSCLHMRGACGATAGLVSPEGYLHKPATLWGQSTWAFIDMQTQQAQCSKAQVTGVSL
jgi:hypothetical protein